MLMRKTNYIFAFLLSMLFGTGTASADVVANYKMDFNTAISTSAHDFKVGTGWGHVVDSYTDDEYYETYYVTYTYGSATGRDNSGAMFVGNQKLGTGWYATDAYDLLVTPKVTGASSIYVKQNSNSGSILFYNVTKEGATFKRSTKIEVDVPALSTSEWTKVEIPEIEGGGHIGIRASNVYIDDFEAASAEIEQVKAVAVNSVINKGSDSPDCTADGKFTVNYSVKLKNIGDLPLTAGMENYSLSLVNYSNNDAVVYTMPVADDLAVGEEKFVTLTTQLDYATYNKRMRYDVMENLTGTKCTGSWLEPVAYAPKLQLRDKNGTIDENATYAYGMVAEATSKEFTIRNAGAAPLKVTAIELPAGFTHDATLPLNVDAHQDVNFNITLPATTPGIFSGNVVVKGEGVDDFTFAVTGSVRDASKYYEDFESGVQPAGTIMSKEWKVSQRSYEGNKYMLTNNKRGSESLFITPLLKVSEGEMMTFDVARATYSSAYDNIFLKVFYSTDRVNWTLAKEIPSYDVTSNRSDYNYYYGDLQNFVLDNVPAGNYYIGFGSGYMCIDNIYGFEKVDVAHDMMVSSSSLPTTATVNNRYTAEMTLKNVRSEAEAAGSYTMTLYVNNEAVATAEATEIGAGAETAFSMSYVPHTPGTVKAYVEFKNTADNYTLKSEEVDLTINAEVASSTKVVGNETSKDANEVLYWMYADNEKGGLSDFYYTPEILSKFGFNAGDKITGVTFTGTPGTGKKVTKVDINVKVGLIEPTSFVPGEGLDALTSIDVVKNADFETETYPELIPVVTNVVFPEPIVWDGTSAIRFYTYIKSNDKKYVSMKYPVDASYVNMSYYKSGSATSWSANKMPVTTFNVAMDPTTISGTVKCGDEAIANATVTLRSEDDIVYSGTTDETGAYSFPVIQTSPVYTLTVSADGYNLYTEENVSMTSSLEKNIQMQKSVVSVTGKVSYRSAGVAGASVSLTSGETVLTASTGETGEYTVENVVPGLSYTLKVTADRFNDYESAEPILIEDAMTLDEVVLTRKAVEVSGKVVYRNAGLQGATVTLSRSGFEQSATTGEDGTYRLEGIVPDYSYAVKVTADKFIGYESAEPVAVDDALVLGDIRLTKPNYKVTGQVKWGNTPVEGVLVQYTGSDNWKLGVYTDAEGKYTLENLNPEMHYLFRVIDLNKEFEDITEADSIFADEDFEKNFSVTALPVEISIPASCYATYSYKRALDLGAATGLKAYVVTEVKKNYIVVSEVSEIPAGTGVLLHAAGSKYEATAVESAAAPGVNMLVGVTGDDFTIGSENVGKAWALTDDGGLSVFKSVAGTTVAKGTAYLACESSEPVIYLNAADGIRSIDGAASIGVLDESKPMYNLAGQKVGKEYRGVVIQNGKKFNR